MIEERFARGNSILHHADPKLKIVGAAILIPLIAVSHSFAVIITGLTISILLTLLAGLKLKFIFRHMAAVNFFLAFLWLFLPFTHESARFFQLGLLRIYLGGVLLGLQITLKANAIGLIITSLLSTSCVQAVGNGLRELGLSAKFTILLLTTFRYVGVIQQEYSRLRRAATLRRFTPGVNLHTYRTFAYLIGMTLVRGNEQAHRVNKAMIMRGFDGDFPVLEPCSGKSNTLVGTILLACSSLLVGACLV